MGITTFETTIPLALGEFTPHSMDSLTAATSPVRMTKDFPPIPVPSLTSTSWDNYDGAEFYRLSIDEGYCTVITNSVDLRDTCNVLGLDSGTYAIELYALDASQNQISDSWHGSYTFTAAKPKLATPENLRLDGAELKWSAVPNAVIYSIIVTEDGTVLLRGTSTTPSYDLTAKLEDGHTYSFAVLAVAPGTNSNYAKLDNILYKADDDTNTDDEPTPIKHIEITVTAPQLGAIPDYNPVLVCDPEDGSTRFLDILWYCIPESEYTGTSDDLWDEMDSDDTFEEGYIYSIDMYPIIEDGFKLTTSTTASVNGSPHCNTYGNVWESYNSSSAYVCLEFGPLHPHEYDGWKSNADKHWHECLCGNKADEAAHSFKWVVDKKATTTSKGSKHEECEICGYKKAAVEIPATGSSANTTTAPNTASPNTGDNSMMWLWTTVLLLSGAAIIVYKRRRVFR